MRSSQNGRPRPRCDRLCRLFTFSSLPPSPPLDSCLTCMRHPRLLQPQMVGADFDKELKTGDALYHTMGREDKPILSHYFSAPNWRVRGERGCPRLPRVRQRTRSVLAHGLKTQLASTLTRPSVYVQEKLLPAWDRHLRTISETLRQRSSAPVGGGALSSLSRHGIRSFSQRGFRGVCVSSFPPFP